MCELIKICPFCDKVCQESKIKQHIALEHLGLKFSNNENEANKNQSKRRKSQKCDQCENSFFDRKTLERHMNTIHITNTNYKCEKCFRVFNRRDNLLRHCQTHMLKGENCLKVFLSMKEKCILCYKLFSTKAIMRRHFKTVHKSKEGNLQCEVCPKVFNRKDNLERHKMTHKIHQPE